MNDLLTDTHAINQPTIATKERKQIGPIVGTAIILAILVLGGLYFWGSRLNRNEQNPPPLILGNDSQSDQR